MPAPIGRIPLVGRQPELAALLERLEAAGQGQGEIVLVAGEPGIGKTRLLAELADRARGSGWQVLVGRAYESEGMPPYLPFAEALRDYFRTCPPESLGAQLAKGAAELAILLPELWDHFPVTRPGPPLSAEHERYRLFESVSDFLLASAREAVGGLLLVLDDLHWADKPSLLLLQHVVRRVAHASSVQEGPLLIVGSYRNVALDHAHPLADLLAELHRQRLADQIPLGALSREEVQALVEALSHASTPAPVAEAIYRATEGNPFFVEEVVRHFQAEGQDLTDPTDVTDLTDPSAALAQWSIPEGVRQVIGRRLTRLSADTSRMLQMGAVLGDGFSFDLLEPATGIGEAPLLDALEEALATGLLREEGPSYHFSHALIRQTIYEGLSFPWRQRLHRRAAQAIERVQARDLGPYAAELAHHFLQAVPDQSSLESGITYAIRAAERALALLAYEEAAGHYERALQALARTDPADAAAGTAERRCRLLLALGDAQRKAGSIAQARDSFQRAAAIARTLGRPEELARAALGFGGVLGLFGVVDEPLAWIIHGSSGRVNKKEHRRVGCGC